jgi:hypothetical protein
VPAAPHSGTPVAPPGRVWDTTSSAGGLRDTDVVRGLPATGGLHQAVQIEGRRFFGSATWQTIGPAVRAGLSHAQMSAALTAMTRGEALLSPVALGRLTRSNAEITARASVLRMEYRRTDGKAEFNPVNEVSELSSQSHQYWWLGGLTGQLGVEVGPVTVDAVLGGQYRSREATSHSTAGRVLANAKIPTPTVIYDAYVRVTITLKNGSRTRDVTGVIPAEIGIPLAETTAALPGVTVFYEPDAAVPPQRRDSPPQAPAVVVPAVVVPARQPRLSSIREMVNNLRGTEPVGPERAAEPLSSILSTLLRLPPEESS